MNLSDRLIAFVNLDRITEQYANANNLSYIGDFNTMFTLLFNDDYSVNVQFSITKKGKINMQERSILSQAERLIFDEVVKRYNNA